MNEMFWTGWFPVLKAVVLAACAYASLLLFLRLSGKRSTGKLNMFDWVVTVALGSMLATTILSQDTPLAAGLTGFAALLGLQFVLSWLSVRSSFVRGIVKAQPKLLFHQGEYLEKNMRNERITREEVAAAAREQGLASLDDVASVVLETNAAISVIEKRAPSDEGTLGRVATPRIDDGRIGGEDASPGGT